LHTLANIDSNKHSVALNHSRDLRPFCIGRQFGVECTGDG